MCARKPIRWAIPTNFSDQVEKTSEVLICFLITVVPALPMVFVRQWLHWCRKVDERLFGIVSSGGNY